MTISRLLARPLLATAFVAGAVDALRHTDAHASRAASVIAKYVPKAQQRTGVPLPTDPVTVVRVHAGVQLAAALALATGRAPRVSAGVLVATTVPVMLTQHSFWNALSPQEQAARRGEFLRDVSLLGGLVLAGVDTDGKPSLAWRAQRAASDARKQARRQRRAPKKHLSFFSFFHNYNTF